MTDKKYNVLFLCTGNSARSIMAESILRKEGGDRFNAFSAGSHPKGAVNPFAIKVLESFGYPTDGMRSKTLGRVQRRGRAQSRFRLHRLRQRRWRSLPGLAGPADDGALGHRRPRRRRGNRLGEGARLRAGVPLFAQPHHHLQRAADQESRQTGAQREAAGNRRNRRRVPWREGSRMSAATDIVIYHNPACGTSRNTLGAHPQLRRRTAHHRISEDRRRAGPNWRA